MTSFTKELLPPTRAVRNSLYQGKPKPFMKGDGAVFGTKGAQNGKPSTWIFCLRRILPCLFIPSHAHDGVCCCDKTGSFSRMAYGQQCAFKDDGV